MLWKTTTSAAQPNPKQFQEAEKNTLISFATIWMQPPLYSEHSISPILVFKESVKIYNRN